MTGKTTSLARPHTFLPTYCLNNIRNRINLINDYLRKQTNTLNKHIAFLSPLLSPRVSQNVITFAILVSIAY